MNTVRVLRVIEYEGSREWVEITLERRAIKGEYHLSNSKTGLAVIREAILGEFPTILEKEEEGNAVS